MIRSCIIVKHIAEPNKPNLVRFLIVDPLAAAAPGWTPYRFGYSNPINFTDPTGLLEDDYKLKQNGEIEKIADTNEPDRLFATNEKGEVQKDNYLTICDDNTLPALSKLRGSGDSYTGLMHSAQSNDGEMMSNLFKFAADNSSLAEWSMVKSSDSGGLQYNIGTFFMDALSPGPKELGVDFQNVLSMVHSHPVATDGELGSMGYSPAGRVIGGSDWNNVVKNYERNGNSNPFPYKVYFPKTQNTYDIHPNFGPLKLDTNSKPRL